MKFEGEHLLPGEVGHFFVLLAFVASLVSSVAYFYASAIKNDSEKRSWIFFARGAFFIQFISLVTVFITIYYICSHHYFEYLYSYKHASKELEPKYLLACIWEGQEGSFILWSLWHCVLGSILIFTSKKREAPILAIVTLAQFVLLLMIVGIYIGDTRIGSSPFVLTRNEINGPIFSQPNYLSFIKDGIGLNVLLRNYWMVIHPPILFLGFASTIVPLGFAYSSLSTKNFTDWIKPALPWTLFSCCVLGVGIMMGGKWAYESLSFGGYWAWDPVENAALVPWMILISGLHCMAVYNSTGNALRASYLFIILAYFFVLYSTFLTRTGILGDTSVHSFTEAGLAMNVLIGIYVVIISLPVLFLFVYNYKKIPAIQKEENISSREFWMFIGSLIFFLAALFIIGVTSLPVYNKVFGTNYADPQDREFTYNKVLVLVAFIIGVLTAFSQYLKYRNTEKKYLIKNIALPVSIAVILTFLLVFFYPIEYTKKGPGFLIAIYIALFASIFSVIANAAYLKTVLKGNLKAGGAAIAHLGFALMITGMLISSGNKKVISDNRKTGLFIPFDKDPTGRQTEDPMENLTLLKNVPTQMGNYTVTYLRDSAASEKNRTFYKLHFQKIDSTTGKSTEDFMLAPDSYRMKDNNLSSNPGTRHYLTHDVFTYISTISVKNQDADTAQFKIHEVGIKDTVFYSKGYFVLNDVLKNPNNERFHFTPSDTALVADITVYGQDSTKTKAYPALVISNQQINFIDDTLIRQNLFLNLAGLANDKKFKIGVKESDIPTDFITLKAYVFPYINLVWAGLLIMACGFVVSIGRRAKAANYITALSVLFVLAGLFYMFLVANS
ncbi:cytochrome c assembly protein [Ginsengibacter hankyongi]|uniref:Cytochrome c assembly protein n=1 Tax=Ginsengibacter hankyongi TaxID=2607284 RepID=A0A5J5IJF2_9BACT|nr:cytochrome c biogenesis protein CcsA [Ginsengibacter hankyongi]KAA9038495.1 cytochrome c assembly protein [Ginsengibacter hankyongi]